MGHPVTARILPAILLGLLLAGCSTTRTTTTARTPIEQALMSASAADSIRAVSLQDMQGASFKLDASEIVSSDKDVIVSMVRQQLLEGGMIEAPDAAKADVTVHARVDFSAIDDSSTLLGVPELPIPVPAVGTFQSPEIAFFKQVTQLGRNKAAFYGVRNSDGSLAFLAEPGAGQRFYRRWTILFLISFRTTNLEAPF